MNKSQDLGNKSIGKLFLQLAIPAVIAQIVNLLYNIVDRIYMAGIFAFGAQIAYNLYFTILLYIGHIGVIFGAAGGEAGKHQHDCQQHYNNLFHNFHFPFCSLDRSC